MNMQLVQGVASLLLIYCSWPAGQQEGSRDRKWMDGWMFSPFSLPLPPAVLKLTAVASGVVVILGTEARRYLAMSDDGRLYSSVSDRPARRQAHTPDFKCIIVRECLITDHTTVVAPFAPADGD